MYSPRTFNAEMVNAEGRLSHHQADGCTLIYRQGDEYADIFPTWNWEMLPGTTAEQYELASDPKGVHLYADSWRVDLGAGATS